MPEILLSNAAIWMIFGMGLLYGYVPHDRTGTHSVSKWT